MNENAEFMKLFD